MKHQRSHSFARDLRLLDAELRDTAVDAITAFTEAAAVADADTAPAFPEWLKVAPLERERGIWEMRWAAHGRVMRATFSVLRRGGDVFVRWRRVSQASVTREEQVDVLRSVMPHARSGVRRLPSAGDLVAYGRTPRGEIVYLERERWLRHIVPHHITDPPNVRGKATTTWWPVVYTVRGQSSMSEDDVIAVVMDAVRFGHWQNAPKGTRLVTWRLPADLAARYGVSEVKVSTAPDGRVLSAYPSAGDNVLAVRQLDPDDAEQVANAMPPAAMAPAPQVVATGWDG